MTVSSDQNPGHQTRLSAKETPPGPQGGETRSDDPVERLRAHVEKHKHHSQVFVSTEGLQALFDLLKVLTADNITLTAQRDVLKEQIDRMLAHRAKVISDVLATAKHQGETR